MDGTRTNHYAAFSQAKREMSNKLKFKLRDDTPLRRHVATFWVVVPLDKATTPHQTNAEAEGAIRRLFPQYLGKQPYELELWTAWDSHWSAGNRLVNQTGQIRLPSLDVRKDNDLSR